MENKRVVSYKKREDGGYDLVIKHQEYKRVLWAAYPTKATTVRPYQLLRNILRFYKRTTQQSSICFHGNYRKIYEDKKAIEAFESIFEFATDFLIILDASVENDAWFQYRIDHALSEIGNRLQNTNLWIIPKLMFIKVESCSLPPIPCSIEYTTFDFSQCNLDYTIFCQSQELRTLAGELIGSKIQARATALKGTKGESHADYIYSSPTVTCLERLPKIINIIDDLTVTFDVQGPTKDVGKTCFFIQKTTITEKTIDFVQKISSTDPFLYKDIHRGTYITIGPYPANDDILHTDLPLISTILLNYEHETMNLDVRILYSSSQSPVGSSPWCDVTDTSCLIRFPKRASDIYNIASGTTLQFVAMKYGTYLVTSGKSTVANFISFASIISNEINRAFARIIVSYSTDDVIIENNDVSTAYNTAYDRKLILTCDVVRLDEYISHYGFNYQDVIVRLPNSTCYAVTTLKLNRKDERCVLPQVFDVDSRSDFSSNHVITCVYRRSEAWSFKSAFYSDSNFQTLLAKISVSPTEQRVWPPVSRRYHRRWSLPSQPEEDHEHTFVTFRQRSASISETAPDDLFSLESLTSSEQQCRLGAVALNREKILRTKQTETPKEPNITEMSSKRLKAFPSIELNTLKLASKK
ncbi:uncharacterized protein LOC141899390 [Tubulanus polymorphus]|uniref:uncharacterized protein LOC141899390 n=1 Tax=Tubulanus polymorphus TaxID=672921 RepID=UPI003DA30D68